MQCAAFPGEGNPGIFHFKRIESVGGRAYGAGQARLIGGLPSTLRLSAIHYEKERISNVNILSEAWRNRLE